MMRAGQDKGLIEEVVVPTEKVVELVKGEKEHLPGNFIQVMS